MSGLPGACNGIFPLCPPDYLRDGRTLPSDILNNLLPRSHGLLTQLEIMQLVSRLLLNSGCARNLGHHRVKALYTSQLYLLVDPTYRAAGKLTVDARQYLFTSRLCLSFPRLLLRSSRHEQLGRVPHLLAKSGGGGPPSGSKCAVSGRSYRHNRHGGHGEWTC